MVRPAAVLIATAWQVRQSLSVRALSSAGLLEAWASWQAAQLFCVTAPWTILAVASWSLIFGWQLRQVSLTGFLSCLGLSVACGPWQAVQEVAAALWMWLSCVI